MDGSNFLLLVKRMLKRLKVFIARVLSVLKGQIPTEK